MSTPPPLPLPHSELGIASFILSLTTLTVFILVLALIVIGKISTFILLIMACMIIAVMWFVTLGSYYPSLKDMGVPEIILIEPWMLITTGLLLVIALILGVVGLMQPESKRVFSIFGCLFSIGGLLTVISINQILN